MINPITPYTRLSTPDLMKGLAVLFMIQVHSLQLFTSLSFQETLFGKIIFFLGGPPAAPVFLAVMGYFLAVSNKSVIRKIKRGLDLIALGILLNLFFNLNLFLRIFLKEANADPFEYLFGVDIFFTAGLSIIIISILQKLFKNKFYLYLISALAVVFIGPLLPDLPGKLKYLQAYFYGEYAWSYFPLLPWLSYSLTGAGFAFLIKKSRGKMQSLMLQKIAFSLLSIVIILFLPYAMNVSSELPLYYHHNWIFFLWTSAFLAWWLMLCHYLCSITPHSGIMHYLRWLGKNVTAIYVIQWIIIGNLATTFYRQFEFWGWLAGFLIALIVSILIGLIWEKYFSQKKKTEINY